MRTTKRNGLRQHCKLIKTHKDACVVDGMVQGLAEKPSTLVPSWLRRGASGQPVPVPDGKPAWGSLSYLEWGCHSPASSSLGHGARAEESIQEKMVKRKQRPWCGSGPAWSPWEPAGALAQRGCPLPFALCSSGRRDQHSWLGRVPTCTSTLRPHCQTTTARQLTRGAVDLAMSLEPAHAPAGSRCRS